MRGLVTLSLVLLVSQAAAACAQLPPALAPLRFLLGAWEAAPGADPVAGTGRAIFSSDLQDRVIVRSSYAAYAAALPAHLPAGGRHRGGRPLRDRPPGRARRVPDVPHLVHAKGGARGDSALRCHAPGPRFPAWPCVPDFFR
jgi:hypothetical protein